MKRKPVHCAIILLLALAGMGSVGWGREIGRRGGQVYESGTADYIVAASNSSAEWKAKANYKCDGTADEEQIQAAINKLESTGGSIFFPAGVYNIASSITLKSGVSLRGVVPGLNLTQNCPDLGFAFSGTGTIFQGASGSKTETIFTGTRVANLELANFGIRNCKHAISVGAINTDGIGFGALQNIFVDTTSDTALVMLNCQQMQVTNVKMYWVYRALLYQGCKTGCTPGNSIFDGLYAYINPSPTTGIAGGTGPQWCVKVESTLQETTPGANDWQQCQIGITHFYRPQVNAFLSANAPTDSVIWHYNSEEGFKFVDADVAFPVGGTITGVTSGKTARIVRAAVSTGSYALGTACGLVVVTDRSGDFTSGESITYTGGGAADLNGGLIHSTMANHTNFGTDLESVSGRFTYYMRGDWVYTSETEMMGGTYRFDNCYNLRLTSVDQNVNLALYKGSTNFLSGRIAGLTGTNYPIGLYWLGSAGMYLRSDYTTTDRYLLFPNSGNHWSGGNVGFAQRVTVYNDGANPLTIGALGYVMCGNTGNVTFVLPAAATAYNTTTSSGASFTFVKTTANSYAITLDGNGSETINGAATNSEIDAQWDFLTITSNGSNWVITNKNISP